MHAAATKATKTADSVQAEKAAVKTAAPESPQQIPLWADTPLPAIQYSPKVGHAAVQVMRMPDVQRQQQPTTSQQQVITLLSQAASLLSNSQQHVTNRAVGELLSETNSIFSNFFPSGFGLMDSNGRVTRRSNRYNLLINYRRRQPVSLVRSFRVQMYLSEQTGTTPAGRYEQLGNLGGRIIFYIPKIVGHLVNEVATLMAHELFHMWAHLQRVVRDAFGRGPAAQAPTRRTAALINPSVFAAHRRQLEPKFEQLINYLNARQRRARNFVRRPARQLSQEWGRRAVEEVTAYVYGVCVSTAVATAQGRQQARQTGQPAVTFGSSFNPVQFLRDYIRNHWLTDPTDRASLGTQQGQAHLNGMRADILRLKSAAESHVNCSNP